MLFYSIHIYQTLLSKDNSLLKNNKFKTQHKTFQIPVVLVVEKKNKTKTNHSSDTPNTANKKVRHERNILKHLSLKSHFIDKEMEITDRTHYFFN